MHTISYIRILIEFSHIKYDLTFQITIILSFFDTNRFSIHLSVFLLGQGILQTEARILDGNGIDIRCIFRGIFDRPILREI